MVIHLQPTVVFLPGECQGQRSLAGYSPWSCKESDTTEQLSTAQHRGKKVIICWLEQKKKFHLFVKQVFRRKYEKEILETSRL